jgi:DNA recombination protein RmuC
VQIAILILLLVVVGLLIVLLLRPRGDASVATALPQLEATTRTEMARVEQSLRVVDEGVRREIQQGLSVQRNEQQVSLTSQRQELNDAMTRFAEHLRATIGENNGTTQTVLTQGLDYANQSIRLMSNQTREQIIELNQNVDRSLKEMRAGNEKKLEEMRATVDEKLQATLHTRINAAFQQVSERLDEVHKGLGEMRTLATGVGDLKRVLTNVKTRGIFGEAQLEAILEQFLTPSQYERNVEVEPGTGKRVEFAVKLPGTDETPLWLPIDAKFPREDYERLLVARESNDPAAAKAAEIALGRTVQASAQEIRRKYISPGFTTDFAILFLPTEGLYAEILRQPAVVETIQQNFRVIVAGPTTLAATLQSLQMGFRTLALQKRSAEVWNLLGAVKTEFGKFGEVIDKAQKQLDTASKTLGTVSTRTRAMQRQLKQVEAMPEEAAQKLLAIPEIPEEEESAED